MRWAVILILALGACSNSGGSNGVVMKSLLERVKAIGEAPEEPNGKQTPSRAQIKALNVAMVQMNLLGEDIYPIMVPTHRNGANVTYANKFRQSLTLNESQIVATRGLGTDLVSATSSANDPLKRLTPPSNWPAQVTREYRFGGGGPSGRIDQYECKLQRGPSATISLAGTEFNVVGFQESCSGPEGSFQNLYAADARTGRVWQSQQFVGHAMVPIVLDILEPLTE